jgi:hypothetical protein
MEAEAVTTLVDLLRLFIAGLEVRLEQSFQIEWADSYPCVFHTDRGTYISFGLMIGHDSYYNHRFFFRKLYSILDQVNQDLLHTQLVDHQVIFELRLLDFKLLVYLFADK